MALMAAPHVQNWELSFHIINDNGIFRCASDNLASISREPERPDL
jgi:hypothetical protein